MITALLKRHKHLWLMILFISLMTATAWGDTAAYLTDQENKENQIAVGDNIITIDEEFMPPDPGLSELFHKEVQIENTGTSDCFVRVLLEFSDNEIAKRAAVSWDGGEVYDPFSDLPGAGCGPSPAESSGSPERGSFLRHHASDDPPGRDRFFHHGDSGGIGFHDHDASGLL